MTDWRPIETAPRDATPFWLGTESGGVMFEAWHWCLNAREPVGCFSGKKLSDLSSQAPQEQFMWKHLDAPNSIVKLKRRIAS